MPLRIWPSMVLTASLIVASSGYAHAQCADGTPAPCRSGRVAVALDPSRWIVLPFSNVGRSAEMDWLREASANLMYLDLARWQEIHAVDYARVTDLMRVVPEAQRQPLGLDAAIAVAKRAGAANLVIGEFLRVGARTLLTAKLYDVVTGRQIRVERAELTTPDSLPAVAEHLTTRIVALEPAERTTPSNAGTTSLAAYRLYLEGVRALNGWQDSLARDRFERAVAIDSTFALALYQLAQAQWTGSTDTTFVLTAARAARLSSSLPPRERTLISGFSAWTRLRDDEACPAFRSLTQADPSDAEAWWLLGACLLGDNAVERAPGDPTLFVAKLQPEASYRALRRALELNPRLHRAYFDLQGLLSGSTWWGCLGRKQRGRTGQCADTLMNIFATRRADTLVAIVQPLNTQLGLASNYLRAERDGSVRKSRRLLLDVATAWLADGPTEPLARLAMCQAQALNGDLAAAARWCDAARNEWRRVDPDVIGGFLPVIMDVYVKTGRVREARRLADSVLPGKRLVLDEWQRVTDYPPALGAFVPAKGAPTNYLSTLPMHLLQAGVKSDVRAWAREQHDAANRALASAGRPTRPDSLIGNASAIEVWGFRLHLPGQPLSVPVSHADPRVRFVARWNRGDTAHARAILDTLDGIIRDSLAVDSPDEGLSLFSAEAHLELGDSATALDRLAAYDLKWVYDRRMLGRMNAFALNVSPGSLWGRTYMLFAELSGARGRRADEVRAYQRVLSLWDGGDPALEPLLEKARRRLVALRYPPTAPVARGNASPVAAPAPGERLEYTSSDGVAYYSMADTGSVARAERALAENPRSADALLSLAAAQAAMFQRREAITTLTRGLTQFPDNAVLYRERGRSLLSIRDLDRALTDLTRARQLDSTDAQVRQYIGLTRYARGDFAGATDDFAAARALARNDAQRASFAVWLWMAATRAGRTQDAERVLAATADSTINPNENNGKLIELFKGKRRPEPLFNAPLAGIDVTIAQLGHGVGTWYLAQGDTVRATEWFKRVIQTKAWPAFGFILAESELRRLAPNR